MTRIEKIIEFLKDSKEDSFLQHALALEYIKINKVEEALALFTEIIEREPGYVGTYYHLGKIWEKKGNTEMAIEIYNRGMDAAKLSGDKHSYAELMAAKEELE